MSPKCIGFGGEIRRSLDFSLHRVFRDLADVNYYRYSSILLNRWHVKLSIERTWCKCCK